jgi:hypothetical protein
MTTPSKTILGFLMDESICHELVHRLTLEVTLFPHQKNQLELLMMMDLVATEDLQAGEELVLAMDKDLTTGRWVLSPELLPAHWTKIPSAPN